jgi:hypothetical protein
LIIVLRPVQEYFTYMETSLWLANDCKMYVYLCSALRAFGQGGISIVPYLLWHGTLVFPVSSEGPPYSVASFYTLGDVEDLFWPASSRVNIERNANNFMFCCYTQSRRVKYMFCMVFHYFKPSLYSLWMKHFSQMINKTGSVWWSTITVECFNVESFSLGTIYQEWLRWCLIINNVILSHLSINKRFILVDFISLVAAIMEGKIKMFYNPTPHK